MLQSIGSRLQPTTDAPFRAKWPARKRPIPRRAPVTRTTWPSISRARTAVERGNVLGERADRSERARALRDCAIISERNGDAGSFRDCLLDIHDECDEPQRVEDAFRSEQGRL